MTGERREATILGVNREGTSFLTQNRASDTFQFRLDNFGLVLLV